MLVAPSVATSPRIEADDDASESCSSHRPWTTVADFTNALKISVVHAKSLDSPHWKIVETTVQSHECDFIVLGTGTFLETTG